MYNYKYLQYFQIIFFILLVPFLVSCAGQTKSNISKDQHVNRFIVSAVKTYQLTDLSIHTVYSVAGDLYKKGKLNEAQKDNLIANGKIVYDLLRATRRAIQDYTWVAVQNQSTLNSELIIKNNFYAISNYYNEIRAELSKYILPDMNIELPMLVIPDNIKLQD